MAQELTDGVTGCNVFKAFQLSPRQVYHSQTYDTTIRYDLDIERNPTVERWAFCDTEEDEVFGQAFLAVTIVEVIETKLCGPLVAYYRQWFDENSAPISARRRHIHKLASVKRFLSLRRAKLMA